MATNSGLKLSTYRCILFWSHLPGWLISHPPKHTYMLSNLFQEHALAHEHHIQPWIYSPHSEPTMVDYYQRIAFEKQTRKGILTLACTLLKCMAFVECIPFCLFQHFPSVSRILRGQAKISASFTLSGPLVEVHLADTRSYSSQLLRDPSTKLSFQPSPSVPTTSISPVILVHFSSHITDISHLFSALRYC